MQVFAPDGEAAPAPALRTPGRAVLSGARVGVLDNGKPNAGLLLTRVAEQLATRTGATLALVTEKGPGGNAATPCTPGVMDRLTSDCDVVLTGSADCGSCTAYSVYDTIELEKAGRPCVVVTTTQFAPIASTMAANFGLPEARTLVLDHPIGGTARETLEGWADAASDRLVELFTAAP